MHVNNIFHELFVFILIILKKKKENKGIMLSFFILNFILTSVKLQYIIL